MASYFKEEHSIDICENKEAREIVFPENDEVRELFSILLD
jgi:hypothetical protein